MQEISKTIWDLKYRFKLPNGSSEEKSISDTHKRVVEGVYAKDKKGAAEALDLMEQQLWCPAGRIHAGAGTGKRVTLINCFVSPVIQDSMDTELGLEGCGIFEAHKVAGLTQQMGGGIGMDFSTLRPDGAIVKRVGSVSSGPLHFMDMWDSMCRCIMSSGSRRGAMMGTMLCTHPDIQKFVNAKHESDRLRMFNVSVLVTDEFMSAVRENKDWDLYFNVPRADGEHVRTFTKNNETFYVYETINAKTLWDKIIKSTYKYAEPGVIFIDRVNQKNNLYYCEHIQATNPCGEQPLPPNGDCDLGAVNLAKMVDNPFTNPSFNFDKLRQTVRVGVKFLDNVTDVTFFPTEEQKNEARLKRRIGLGITGLGNMLQQMKLKYGSEESLQFLRSVMQEFRDEAYRTSIELAKERGAFPCYEKSKYLKADFISTLPDDIRDGINDYGIRNGVLLTIAPTGTTSIYYDNISSGIEPSFDLVYNRKMLLPDGTFKQFNNIEDYGFKVLKEKRPDLIKSKHNHEIIKNLPDYMITAKKLSVREHLLIQAVCQEYIDASITKTINCPEEMSFLDFKDVYTMAYDMGLKGCTTYRPSKVRGEVLSTSSDSGVQSAVASPTRPKTLQGYTYKARWPSINQALYITINDYVDEDGVKRPFEVFINSKSVKHQEWVTALTRTISAVFRKGGDISFIVEELEQVYSNTDGHFIDKKFVPSIVALIGSIIRQHLENTGLLETIEEGEKNELLVSKDNDDNIPLGSVCPRCNLPHLISEEGCSSCYNCGYSNCE